MNAGCPLTEARAAGAGDLSLIRLNNAKHHKTL
jgi:hypothetical protein